MKLRRAHFFLLAAAPLLFCLAAPAQKLSYVPVEETTVLARLRNVQYDNKKRFAELKAMFAAAGCQGDHVKEQAVAGTKLPNLLCVLPGKTESTIVVGAHFDHVEYGMGAIDNWTGASLLPSLYQTLAEEPREHTFVFIGFTDEEKGLVGSRAYVQQLTPEEKARIFGMVNFDSLGTGPTQVWGNASAPGLLQVFSQAAGALKIVPHSMTILGSDADSDSFSRAGIPAITMHSLGSMEQLSLLHTVKDKMSAITPAEFYGNYRFAAVYLLLLDTKSDLNVPPPTNTPPAKTTGSDRQN